MLFKLWKRGNQMNWDKLVDMISDFCPFNEYCSCYRMVFMSDFDRFGVFGVEMDNIALSSHFIFFL